MKAVKGNKEYTIDETQKKGYQDAGFDIIDTDGKVIYYGRGRTVPYEAHMRAVEEIEKLRCKVVELESSKGESEDNKEIIGIISTYAVEHQIDIGKAATIDGILKKIKEQKPEGGA